MNLISEESKSFNISVQKRKDTFGFYLGFDLRLIFLSIVFSGINFLENRTLKKLTELSQCATGPRNKMMGKLGISPFLLGKE